MKTTWAGALTAALLIVPAVAAQAPADFSGRWTLAPSGRAPGAATGSTPPTLSAQGDMGSGWGPDVTITQDASTLTVTYTYFHPREIQPPFTFKYSLADEATTNAVNMGRGPQEQISKTSWQGTALVIATTHRFVKPGNGESMTSNIRQVLSLESPTVLVIEATRDGALGGRPSTSRTVYNKNQDARRK